MSENVSSAHSIKSAEETEGPDAQTAPSAAAKQKRGLRAISLPGWIGLGALAGIVAGLLFGERMSIVAPLGSAYAMMLQIAVYPYLLCSLLYGLGQLTPERAKRLFRASWSTYLFMWIVTLASIWILARAIPPTPLPSVLTTDSQRTEVEFFNLLIPAVSEMGCKDSCNGLICNIGASLELNLRLVDHLGPLRGLRHNQGLKVARRHRHWHTAQVRKACLDLRVGESGVYFLVQPIDDFA